MYRFAIYIRRSEDVFALSIYRVKTIPFYINKGFIIRAIKAMTVITTIPIYMYFHTLETRSTSTIGNTLDKSM